MTISCRKWRWRILSAPSRPHSVLVAPARGGKVAVRVSVLLHSTQYSAAWGPSRPSDDLQETYAFTPEGDVGESYRTSLNYLRREFRAVYYGSDTCRNRNGEPFISLQSQQPSDVLFGPARDHIWPVRVELRRAVLLSDALVR